MVIRKRKNATLFILNQAFDDRIKMLNLAYALMFFFAALFLLHGLVSGYNPSRGNWIMIVGALAFLFCFYRFINKAILSERLLVNADEIIFISKQLSRSVSITYDRRKISNLRYMEKKLMAPHPLAGQSIDYLGFQTSEVLINQLDGEKQISFDYEGKPVLLGTDLYSYEFDEIKSAFDRYSGGERKIHQPDKIE